MRLSLFVALVVATIALCSFSPASANEAAQIDEKVLADFLAELTESDNAGRNLRTIQTVEDEEDSIDAQNEERAGGTALEHAAKQFAALGKGNLTPIDKAKLASQLEKMKSVARQFNAAGKGQLQALEKGQALAIAEKLKSMEKNSKWQIVVKKLRESDGNFKPLDTKGAQWRNAFQKVKANGFKLPEAQTAKAVEGAAKEIAKTPSKWKSVLKKTLLIGGGIALLWLIFVAFKSMTTA